MKKNNLLAEFQTKRLFMRPVEPVEPVMDYAFNELGFAKLTFANARGNKRSGRVKEKTGARLIDIQKASFVDPQYKEQEIWELKKEDWIGFKKKTET